MPIYAYRCTDCGFQDEYLQKMSEPPMTVCPSCGKEAFRKQLTAAGFQLKGSGWYASDFRTKSAKPAAAGESTEAKAETKSDSKPDGKTETKTETKTDSSGATTKSEAPAC